MATEKKPWYNIKKDLLPVKAHYFFFYGGMGGTVPFMQVVAKALGISATAVGVIYTVLPFCVFFSKPFFGYLADHFQNLKVIMLVLIAITTGAFMSVLGIPAINDIPGDWQNVQVNCTNNVDKLNIVTRDYKASCLKELKTNITCELSYYACDINKSNIDILNGLLDFSQPITYTNETSIQITFWLNNSSDVSCECIMNNNVSMKSSPAMRSCLLNESAKSSVYRTYQFWVFMLLAVIAGTGCATIFCLSDAACCEVLGEDNSLFGRQRLWATISWGFVTLLSGYLNDIATALANHSDYSPGFYVMLVFVIIDVIILMKIRLTKASFSVNICKDIGEIFSSCKTIVFAIGVFIVGALTGLIWNYELWYLQDLGAHQTLLGLSVAVQCLAAEVPFFFFAGWFIKKLGHFYCLSISFLAFAIRLGLYSILENPWLVLPIEVLHGLTYAVFYASMTGYASENAPSGTEATMLGILGGLFEGLGLAAGSFLGGIGFDKLRGRKTFLSASIISLICAP
ncbi:Major facilitator superfamily domain-containing protein 6, partial [Stegodyphus mimosarum]